MPCNLPSPCPSRTPRRTSLPHRSLTFRSPSKLIGPAPAAPTRSRSSTEDVSRASRRVDLTQEPWLHRDVHEVLRPVEDVGQLRQGHAEAELFEPVYRCRHALHDIDKLVCPIDSNMFRVRREANPSFRRHSLRHPTSIPKCQCDDTLAQARLDLIANRCLEIASLQCLGPDDGSVYCCLACGHSLPAEGVLAGRMRRENAEDHEGC